MTEPTSDEIDDAVSAWHASVPGSGSLHKYLGWTWDEYALWIEQSIVPARPLREGPR